MQKIPKFLRRLCAYTIPAVIAAGSAGGTVMVIISRDSIIMVLACTCGGHRENSAFLEQVLLFYDFTTLTWNRWKQHKTVLHHLCPKTTGWLSLNGQKVAV